MTPTKTECTTNRYAFEQLERRQVVADFSGGQITTDGGLILVTQVDKHYPSVNFLLDISKIQILC